MDDDQSVNLQQFLTKTNADIRAKGVTFDNSFVNYSLCCPSRSTMLTGQYAQPRGQGNQLPSGGTASSRRPSATRCRSGSARRLLHRAHIGKFLNGYGATVPDTTVPPAGTRVRLDRQSRSVHGGTYTAYGYTLNENGQIVHYGTTPGVVDPATYQTDVYSQKAADFIRRRAPSNKPFYLSVAPRDPHSEAAACNCAGDNPRAAPRYQGHFAGLTAPRNPDFNEADVSDKPSNIKSLPSLTPTAINNVDDRYRARAEAVLGVDDLVQNVVSTIQQQGELKNTVLMFTSDNGFFHGEHRVPQGKVRLYEPSIRVPLQIRAPGMPKGVHRSQPVGNVDLTETILDFAHAKPGRKEDGMSLVPIMEKKRYWPGRAMDLETFFTPDALEDPEDPPLNYQGVRTDRYLRELRAASMSSTTCGTIRSSCRTRRPIPPMRRSGLPAGAAQRTGELRRQDLPRAARSQAQGPNCSEALVTGKGSPRRRPSICGAKRSAATRSHRSASACTTPHPARSWRRWRARSTGGRSA
jgi:arylsulfatase A-like enzyme